MVRIKLFCVLVFLAFVVGVLLTNNPMTPVVRSYSNGAPAFPGYTGAPGESTCTACHDQNSGVGVFTINAPASYAPGQTYQIQVQHTTTDQTRLRWGFQLTALAGLNPVGTFTENSPYVFIEAGDPRIYVNHTDEGTFAGQANGALWTFQWTAPAVSAGPVTFYAAGNQANNNNNFIGDQIYTAAVTSNPAGTPTPTPALTGKVRYKNTLTANYPVPNVTLNAIGTLELFAVTDVNGDYSLSGFGSGAYTVTPMKVSMSYISSNGIFSNDAALIAQHVVGLITLNNNQQESAKVAGNAVITSFDAALIARWIVGIDDTVNLTGKWKFTPPDRSYAEVGASQSGQDFAGTLMGDVNGDWVTGAGTRSGQLSRSVNEPVIVSVPDTYAAAGTEVTIPIRIDGLAGEPVSSYQFDVEYDPSVIKPGDAAVDLDGTMSSGLSAVSNQVEPGLLRVVVYGPLAATGDGVYAFLRFNVAAGVGSSSSVDIRKFRLNDGTDTVIACGAKLLVTNGSLNAAKP
jgi:hypothetical protein